jgi:hypothetical protein
LQSDPNDVVRNNVLEGSFMKIRIQLVAGIAAGALMFGGCLAHAQTPDASKANASTTVNAQAKSNQGNSPAEAEKNVAGVKYEDRTADVASGLLDSKSAQEKVLSAQPAADAAPNEMAIKENGRSSKPVAKPHQ